jgi:hypothetical protein
MAFKGASVALFDGLSDIKGNAATAYGDTRDWDGKHWTERQDMGPKARWLHAMVFDSARARLVLFGGSTTLAVDSQVGDTWEAPGDSAPATPGGVVLASVEVGFDGLGRLAGRLGLSSPAPAGGVVVLLSVDSPIGAYSLGNESQANIDGPPWQVPVSSGATVTNFHGALLFPGHGTLTFSASLGDVTKTFAVTVPVI